jgi:2'-hydroxyisoflavone reductase
MIGAVFHQAVERKEPPVRILILGGTLFLGRALVEAALARGHDIALFNRGKRDPGLFPEVENLRGDRDGDLTAIKGRSWDVTIDTCGYVPRIVRASAGLLSGAVERYVFISSISVYPDLSIRGVDEGAAVGALEDPTVEKVDGETYGPLKALCEAAAEEALPGRVLNIRPGLIVGPFDPSDRFTYWIERIARGGEVLAPGLRDRVVQVIDVRDLAEWTIRMAESRAAGVYNATGPDSLLTLGEILDTSRAVIGSDARFTWVSEEFLSGMKVVPWTEIPVWVPDEPDSIGLFTVDCRKALSAGLTFRSIEQTVRDTVAWCRTLPGDRARRAGLAPEREAEILASWHARQR